MDKYFIYAGIFYLLVINIISFILMYSDKKRARKHMWRIKESTLFLGALLGGGIGAIAGMYIFRHKTRHWYFKLGMPLILLLWICLIAVLWHFYG